jgi:hypothetical protein
MDFVMIEVKRFTVWAGRKTLVHPTAEDSPHFLLVRRNYIKQLSIFVEFTLTECAFVVLLRH